ncbi:MAG: glycosyl transferase, group 1 [Firmicutes bacterium]|nr:glycosyl transferase, group 1 [Bacillota bacterium]
MHIMFYYGTLQQGGAERVISSLANDFVKRGAEVSILVVDEKPSLYSLDARIHFINLSANAHSKTLFAAIKNNLRRISLTCEVFKGSRPDIVVCFGINNLAFALAAKRCLPIKIVGSERSNPFRSEESFFWKTMKKLLSPYADGYIFSTEGAKSYYPAKTRNKSAVIPNGIFADTMPETVPEPRKRRPRTICATGRLEAVKGFDTLINAFARFHESFPDHTLHIYGEGGQQVVLEKLIREKGLEKHAFLEGYAVDVPAALCRHTMFAFASRHEGMPNSMIEALACGLPCVATDCDFGPSELIRDGQNGLLVPVDDVAAMADAMKRIASDELLAKKLSQNALKIRETHSMEKISKRFYEYIIRV